MMGTSSVKSKVQELMRPFADVFSSLGITPNILTVSGFFFSIISGVLISLGNFIAAFVFFCLSGLCDMMDGVVARSTGKASPFGAFLDSFLDRYSDFFPFMGFSIFAFFREDFLLLVVSLFTIIGSFATSYARARAESLGIDCKLGIVERPERFFLTAAAIISGYAIGFLSLLAVFSNITAFQRLLCAAEKLKE